MLLLLAAVAAPAVGQDESPEGPTFDLRALVARARAVEALDGTTFEAHLNDSEEFRLCIRPASGDPDEQTRSSLLESRTVERVDAPQVDGGAWGETVHVVDWVTQFEDEKDSSLAGLTFRARGGSWEFRDGGRQLSDSARRWVTARLSTVRFGTQGSRVVLDGLSGLGAYLSEAWLPSDPVRVGEAWDLPEEVARSELQGVVGQSAKLGAAAGSARLVDVVCGGDSEAETIEVEFQMNAPITHVLYRGSTIDAGADSRVASTTRVRGSILRPAGTLERRASQSATATIEDGAVVERSYTLESTYTRSPGGEIPEPALAVENVEVPRKGVFAEIDVDRANDAIAVLLGDDEASRDERVADIQAHPELYAPPALYALASVLFKGGRQKDAACWFYLARMWAVYDAMRCTDKTARQGVTVLDQQFGVPIARWAVEHKDVLRDALQWALDMDEKTHIAYDHRWINLHGMIALSAGLGAEAADPGPLTVPEEEWPAILEEIRAGMQTAIERAQERNEPADEPADDK